MRSSPAIVSACGVSAFRKGSDVTLDLDLGSIGIRQSRSSIRRLPPTPIRRHASPGRHVSPHPHPDRPLREMNRLSARITFPNRARARYRSPGSHQKKPWLPSFTSVLPQRPALDQQRSKLDHEHEHDSGRQRDARAYLSDAHPYPRSFGRTLKRVDNGTPIYKKISIQTLAFALMPQSSTAEF
jgi:hypothetical protein